MQNVQNLGKKIKSHMGKANLSVRDLERLAGLKRSAISNILDGRVKKPSLDTLRAIAKAFNCPLTEFLELEEIEILTRLPNVSNPEGQMTIPVDLLLLSAAMEIVFQCFKNANHNPPLDLFWPCVKKVYVYALGSGENSIDARFAEWVVDEITNRDV